MKTVLLKALYDFLSFLNSLSKKKKRVMFYGGDYLEENTEAMFRYLLENSDYELICVANTHLDYKLREKVKFVKNSYFNAAYYMMTSRIILDSSYHTIKMKPAKGQAIVQMWHGTPIKNMDGRNNLIEYEKYYSHIFNPSPFTTDLMLKTFNTSEEKLYLAGYPRNDYLFYSMNSKIFGELNKKVIVWMPTYRHWNGVANTTKQPLPIISEDNAKIIDDCLFKCNVVIYLKPHRLESASLNSLLQKYNLRNIKLITDEDLKAKNVPVYSFVGSSDALITDYSSVYYDYLLLNRQIGFTIDDFEEYRNNVGFILDDPLKYMAGEFIRDTDSFITFIKNVACSIDEYKEQREKMNTMMNYYRDNQSSERCYKFIQDLMR